MGIQEEEESLRIVLIRVDRTRKGNTSLLGAKGGKKNSAVIRGSRPSKTLDKRARKRCRKLSIPVPWHSKCARGRVFCDRQKKRQSRGTYKQEGAQVFVQSKLKV